MQEEPAHTVDPAAVEPANGEQSLLTPVALLAVALFLWSGFEMVQLVRDRGAMKTIRTNQESTVQESTKLRAQLDSIARETAELAAQGNPNAKLIVDELRKRGITINPNPSAPTPAPPTK